MDCRLIDCAQEMLYKPDPYRFVMLGVYCAYCVFIGLFMNPYAPIANSMRIAYEVTVPQIIATMICFLTGKLITAPFAGIVLELVGLKRGIFIAVFLMAVGLLLRAQMNVSFCMVLIAQVLLGAAAAMIVSGQMKFLYEWFHPKSRGYSTTIVAFAFTIGGGFGMMMILIFVTDTETDADVIKSQISTFDNAHLIATLTIAVIHAVLFLNKPRTGYGYQPVELGTAVAQADLVLQTEKSETSNLTAKQQFFIMFHQKGFKLLLFMSVLQTGVNLLNASVITIVYDEFGFRSSQKAILLVSLIISSALGSIFFVRNYLLTPHSRRYFSTSVSLTIFAYIINIVFFLSKMPFLLVWLAQVFYGSVFFLGLTATMEYIINCVKDVPLTFVNGFTFFFGQTFACALLLLNCGIFWLLADAQQQAIYCTWGISLVALEGLSRLSKQEVTVGVSELS